MFYGNRKDALVAAAEQTAARERASQNEQANQQRDAEIAEANRQAAEAQARAEKLEQEKAPRHIDAKHEQQLLAALQPFANAKVRIWIQQDKEAHEFGNEVVQIFQKAGAGRHDVLVVFSDMWQETREFSFGRMTGVCAPEAMEKVRAQKLLANLRDADVEILGTDSPGRNKAEWACVRDFWMKYFAEAGANLRAYSVIREIKASLVQ